MATKKGLNELAAECRQLDEKLRTLNARRDQVKKELLEFLDDRTEAPLADGGAVIRVFVERPSHVVAISTFWQLRVLDPVQFQRHLERDRADRAAEADRAAVPTAAAVA